MRERDGSERDGGEIERWRSERERWRREREENASIDHIQNKNPFKRVIALRVRERDGRERE